MPTVGLKLRKAPALIVAAVASLAVWAGGAVAPASAHGESGLPLSTHLEN